MIDLTGLNWRKSTHSGLNDCAEIAFVDGHVAIRDSKDKRGPVLLFTAAEWRAFLAGARDGEFDLP
jgi:prepilin-type processing-associated H-X9-DG protein